jgi:sigma-B regulation protein RsbU (phosphoserine phosphatase)
MIVDPNNLDPFLEPEFVYNQLPAGFISFKHDGTVLRVNETLANWLGKGIDEVYTLNFKDLLTKASVLYYNLVIVPIINLQNQAHEINLKFNGEDGSLDTLFSVVGYKDELGTIVLMHATILKIADRKKYESTLLHQKQDLTNSLSLAQETLEENAQLFIDIASDQSHMIRKPLANIIGLVNLLNQEELSEHCRDLLELLTESSAELDSMIKRTSIELKK